MKPKTAHGVDLYYHKNLWGEVSATKWRCRCGKTGNPRSLARHVKRQQRLEAKYLTNDEGELT